MQFAGRSTRQTVLTAFIMLAALLLPLELRAAEKPRIRAEDYTIDAKISPQTHKLTARAVVKFVALDDISIATFELHNALRVTQVTDAQGAVLAAERVSQDSSVRVPLPAGMSKGQEGTLTFDYEGIVTSADDSPVPGLKLAYIGDPISYLLYSGRWFPVTNYGIDRFTARLNVTAPAEYTVISSGAGTAGQGDESAKPIDSKSAKEDETPKLQSRSKAGAKAKASAAAKAATGAELSWDCGGWKVRGHAGQRSGTDGSCVLSER
jgi:hypothetical protein